MASTEDVIKEINEQRAAKKKGGPGRYKKDDPRSGQKPRWTPITWKPDYDLVVALFIQGYSQKDIATRLNYSPMQVGNILATPQAVAIKNAVSERIRDKALNEIPDKIMGMANRAMHVMDHVLNDEDVLASHPIAMFDRAAGVLQSLGKMKNPKDASTNINITNGIVIPAENALTFMNGIAAADKYKAEEPRQLTDGSTR